MRVRIVWGGPGRGHRSRAEAVRDALVSLGHVGCVASFPGEGFDLTVEDTPEHPIAGRPLRREFWKRCLIALGSENHRGLAFDLPGIETRILRGEKPRGVREQMEWADVAISNGGQTLNELMSLSVPTIAIDTGGDGEADNIAYWHADLIAALPWEDSDIAARVRELLAPWTDEGVAIAERLLFCLRPATEDDIGFLLELARDTHEGTITDAEHDAWCGEHLASERIIEVAGERVGRVRVECGEVSIAIAREHRGKRYGKRALAEITRGGSVHARVRADNTASRALFESCGFDLVGGHEDEVVYALRHARHEA